MGTKLLVFIATATLLFGGCSGPSTKIVNDEPVGDGTTRMIRGRTPEALSRAMDAFLHGVDSAYVDIHSIMVVQHGRVVLERWMGEGAPDEPHVLHSLSKTFTSTAVGFAIAEGRLALSDKLISFYPDDLPDEVSDNLAAVTVEDLLTMTCGQDESPSNMRVATNPNWERTFLAQPFVHTPGTYFVYNNGGSYMLSSIMQRVTGQTVLDYLTPRLFDKLGIKGMTWRENPQGVNLGSGGLYLKTEDIAKVGQLYLQDGKWNGEQVLPEGWVSQASAAHVRSLPTSLRPEQRTEELDSLSDWAQGYGYHIWRCRHNGYRGDGADGQFMIVLPDQDAVIAVTAELQDMQGEINLLWDYILPALIRS